MIMSMGRLRRSLAIGLATWAGLVAAQSETSIISGVYTCTDARGRKLTSDRPIPECTDREQKILGPSGTVKAKIGPTLTAAEKAELELREKRELEARNRNLEERRRDRALLTRYPSKAVHDGERREALAMVNVVIHTAKKRLDDLVKQRVTIDAEMEFYKKDPSKAPLYLRRQVDENTQSQTAQKRFINEQETELQRVDERFDDELARLRQLWQLATPAR